MGSGIGILISGIVLVILLFVLTYAITSYEANASSEVSGVIWIPIVIAAFGIAYIVLFIWQIFNARKLAKFNEAVRTTGKEPW